MSTRGDILRRAAQVEPGAVPEPWRPSDDEDALATVSDREHYRKNLVTLPDGAGEVPAYVWDFPRTPTIPDEVREEWTRSSAGRVLNAQGQYVSRASDVPRKSFDGEDPGLLVEAASRTNQAEQSYLGSSWFDVNTSRATLSDSIIDGETGYKVESTTEGQDRVRLSTGTFTGGSEVAYHIIEQVDTGITPGIGIKDDSTAASKRSVVGLDFTDGSATLLLDDQNLVEDFNARILAETGPFGRKVGLVMIRYSNTSGKPRILEFLPAGISGTGFTIHYHAQIEEAPNASSPIVTNGSATTRAADEYSIFSGGQPDWWNPNEGTIILDLSVQTFEANDFASQMHPIGFQGDGFSTSFGLRNGAVGESVYFLRDTDNSIRNKVSDVNPFGSDSIAFSFTSDERILSVNGVSGRGPSNGDFLSTPSMKIGVQDRFIGSIGDLQYIPRALSESTLNRITA